MGSAAEVFLIHAPLVLERIILHVCCLNIDDSEHNVTWKYRGSTVASGSQWQCNT